MWKLSCVLVALAACTDAPLVVSLDSHAQYATVYDDGASLRITGCSDGRFLGCGTPAIDVVMTVTTDGTRHHDQDSAGAIVDQLLGLFRDGPFQQTVPRPADGQLGIALAGRGTIVGLPAGFAAATSATQLTRTSDHLIITHEVLAGGVTEALVLSTCGNLQRTELFEETTPGTIDLAFATLPASAGICVHEIHVDQRVALASPGLPVDVVRIERLTATSTF